MVSEKLVTDVNRILWVDVTTDQNEVIRFSAHTPWDDGKRPLEGPILDPTIYTSTPLNTMLPNLARGTIYVRGLF